MDHTANEGLKEKLHADAQQLIERLNQRIERLERVSPASNAKNIKQLKQVMDTIRGAIERL